MKKKEHLLEYLKRQPKGIFIASRELAEFLDVTDRSVRYYVKQINEDVQNLIETAREGYRYNHQQEASLEARDESSLKGRRFSILRRLFKSAEGADLFDLAEEFYVSEATIRSDMSSLQEMAKKYKLKISQKDFRFHLIGEEKNKRILITDLIQKPNSTSPSLEREMQRFLGETSLTELTDFCRFVFKKHQFSSNRYFEQNFILHLIISLNHSNKQVPDNFSSPSLSMVEEINHWLENHNQSIAAGNLAELAVLCDGEIGQHSRALENYVSPQISEALKKALQELNDVFLIDFSDEQFLTRLFVHTQNLYNRVKSNKTKRNLSTIDIKVQYPTLFDIAIYLSSVISKELDIEISEDEISFLALHIGSFLDEQKSNSRKIKTYFEGSNYIHNTHKVQNLLLNKFEDLIFVDSGGKAELELNVGQRKVERAEYVRIHEIINNSDLARIHEAIEKIKRRRYSEFLNHILPEMIQFREESILDDEMTKSQVFERISKCFYQQDFVEEGYVDKLWAREKMSSTTFTSGISLPHTVKYEANKTGLLVIRPEHAFSWEGQEVKLVIGIAVSPIDSQDFNRIFPRMIECLVDAHNIRKLRNCKDQETFIKHLTQLMTRDNYYDE
jgi:lichenan operon transcriptional antiterminator